MSINLSRAVRRWAAVAGAALAIAGALQVTGGTPASAVSGVHRTASPATTANSFPSKSSTAVCPNAEVPVGGGAWISAGPASEIRLTQVEPMQLDEFAWGVTATAQEPARGFSGTWTLDAYAICAPVTSVPGWDIVEGTPTVAQGAFVGTAVACPAGKRVIGTGATINGVGVGDADGRVGLQMVRSSGPLDIARATAREDAQGYSQPWTLKPVAICVNGVPGQHADGEVVTGSSGVNLCDAVAGRPTLVHSAGGGGGTIDGGLSWLQGVRPESNLQSWTTKMTAAINGGIVVHGVCAHS